MAGQSVFIYSAVRTPIGSFGGSLAKLTAPQLGSIAIKEAVGQSGLELGQIEEVYMGLVCQAGVGQAPARQASILAGLPNETPCTTVNKVCASGMKALMLAAQGIKCGDRDIMVAGGMESMSNVPYYKSRGISVSNDSTDGIVQDGLTDVYNKCHMAIFAENYAKKLNISREEQDDYAIRSYKRSGSAHTGGLLKNEIVPVIIPLKSGERVITEDDEYKLQYNVTRMNKLTPAFQPVGGTVTSGNASKLSDGASALVLVSGRVSETIPTKPLARIVDYCDAAGDPSDYPMAPVTAMKKLLEKANITKDQVALWELNESFSAVAIANIKLMGLNPDKVTLRGGAVSLGHPIGMSGARLVTHLCHALKAGEYGVASICNGGGGASAILIQKM